MRFIVAADDDAPLVAHVASELRARGHEVEVLPKGAWGPISKEAASRVASGEFDQGVVMCWTGTGASIAANKVAGIRAALCGDATTAAGAREWNDANVLALSLRLITPSLATEILAAWLQTPYGSTESESLSLLL